MHQLPLGIVSQGTLMGLLHLFLPNPICCRLCLSGSRSQGPALSISMQGTVTTGLSCIPTQALTGFSTRQRQRDSAQWPRKISSSPGCLPGVGETMHVGFWWSMKKTSCMPISRFDTSGYYLLPYLKEWRQILFYSVSLHSYYANGKAWSIPISLFSKNGRAKEERDEIWDF